MSNKSDKMVILGTGGIPENRRRAPRRSLPPMYTGVTVQRVTDLRLETLHGHAYDLSMTGVRIELDTTLEPGEPVAINLDLPGECVAVFASARVVWVADEADDPGPRRIALEFLDFLSDADRQRLIRYIALPSSDNGVTALAA